MTLRAIGLMSGTSMDGIDLAELVTDGEGRVERVAFHAVPYEASFRRRLEGSLATAAAMTARDERPGDLGELEREITLRHAAAVEAFLDKSGCKKADIDVIGFHGQTVLHRPQAGFTVQLGDGQLLADTLGIDVVHDMRANDMVHGGQGAPLVPAYHRALAESLPESHRDERPVAFVNIGGIANITFVGADGELVAFDCGPGNTLIDQWVAANAGIPYDAGGAIASEGRVLPALAARYLSHPFFTAETRLSLDRGDFRAPEAGAASLEDGARTLAYVTASAIAASQRHLPEKPKLWILTGGGRLNRMIVADLTVATRHSGEVVIADELGLNGDAMEAEAWAYLAVRSLKGLPLTFPGTTGVREPVTGGILSRPRQAGLTPGDLEHFGQRGPD